jgi:hypothetical protein
MDNAASNGMRVRLVVLNHCGMDLEAISQEWHQHGFAIIPGYLRPDELAPALSELDDMFPSAAGFHDGTDPRRDRFLEDEFDGIDHFPFASAEMSLLAVNERLVQLAERLLEDTDIRLYSAEAWAKYTGAVDYDQALHRDYLNHTLLVPTTNREHQQVEMFVYLVDVPEDLGPPHLVSQLSTRALPAKPNWYPRSPVEDEDQFVSAVPRPDLYDAEISAAGPAGTVVLFQPGTLHRGTGLRAERGVRYSMHLGYRPARVEWAQRQAWADSSHSANWYRFVRRADARQLALFGFPPPGHPYWTPDALAGVAQRYPELDLTPWRG